VSLSDLSHAETCRAPNCTTMQLRSEMVAAVKVLGAKENHFNPATRKYESRVVTRRGYYCTACAVRLRRNL